MAPIEKNFSQFFSLGLGHDSLTFSDRKLGGKFGKKFSPRGVRPPKFLERLKFGTKSSVPAKFGGDISKTVACRREQQSRADRKQTKLDNI